MAKAEEGRRSISEDLHPFGMIFEVVNIEHHFFWV